MKNILLILFICVSFLNAKDSLVVQQQNVLYVQNLIDIEEKIASNFEKYLLQKFEIPTLEKLKTDEYLGSNFTVTNKFGANINIDNISFITTPNLKFDYAITKTVELYVKSLYKRELYRDMTTVYEDNDVDKSYVSFELKSKEAKNIFSILKTISTETKKTIDSSCTTTSTGYCIANLNTIRWYDANSYWIEYSISDFEDGNVTISTAGLLTNSKLDNLKVGASIFVKDGDKYLKLLSSIVRID